MSTIKEVTFVWHGLDVTATVLVEEADAVTPGSVEIDEIESVSCEGQEMPDEFVSYEFEDIAQAAVEAYERE